MTTSQVLTAGASKLSRHRERQRAAGLRLVQLWAPDTRAPELAAQLRDQCLALKGVATETEAIGFAEAAAAAVEGWQ